MDTNILKRLKAENTRLKEVTLPEKAEQTLPLNFWERLEMFVENVQVNDPMSEEEKEMILMVAKGRKEETTK